MPLLIVNDTWLFEADQLLEVIKFSKFLQEESIFWQNTENLISFCLKFLVIPSTEVLIVSKNNFSTANFIMISFLKAIHALIYHVSALSGVQNRKTIDFNSFVARLHIF